MNTLGNSEELQMERARHYLWKNEVPIDIILVYFAKMEIELAMRSKKSQIEDVINQYDSIAITINKSDPTHPSLKTYRYIIDALSSLLRLFPAREISCRKPAQAIEGGGHIDDVRGRCLFCGERRSEENPALLNLDRKTLK